MYHAWLIHTEGLTLCEQKQRGSGLEQGKGDMMGETWRQGGKRTCGQDVK